MSKLKTPEHGVVVRVVCGTAVAFLLAGVLMREKAEDVVQWAEGVEEAESQVVKGVEGQVEGKRGDTYGVFEPFRFDTYELKIEQCPEDITAARLGEPASAYDPEVGSINVEDGCISDWVRVGADAFKVTEAGDIFAISGTVGEPATKIRMAP